MPNRLVEDSSAKTERLEAEMRTEVRDSLKSLESSFALMSTDNERQHSELGRRLERYHGETKAEIAELRAVIEQSLKRANKNLESKSRLIRWLVAVIVALIMFGAGVKAHALGWIKDFMPF